jgi:hypothetical protein
MNPSSMMKRRTPMAMLLSACALTWAQAHADITNTLPAHTATGPVESANTPHRIKERIVGDPVVRFSKAMSPQESLGAGESLSPQPSSESLVTTAPTPTPPAPTTLHISAGERLSVALTRWLQTRDMTMSWEATGSLPGRMRDVVLERDWAATDTDVVQTLTQVLEPFALNAQIVQQPSQTTVVIRNQSPAASASASQPQ